MSRYDRLRMRPRVLVVGDMVLDHYDGAAGPLHRMGCAANIFACIDPERFDRRLYSAFADPELALAVLGGRTAASGAIVRRSGGDPNVVHYVVEGNKAVQRRDAPVPAKVSHDLEALAGEIAEADILVVCDHRLGTLTRPVKAMIRSHGRRFRHSYVDCRHGNFEDYRSLECLLPNPEEFAVLKQKGFAFRTGEDFRAAGFREMFRKLGPEGVRWSRPSREEAILSPQVEVADDFGAGDFLIAELVNAHGILPHHREGIERAVEETSSRLAEIGGGLLREAGSGRQAAVSVDGHGIPR